MSASRRRINWPALGVWGGLVAFWCYLAPALVCGQAAPIPGVLIGRPDGCTPAALLTGRDTAWLYVPCRRLDVLEPRFRVQVDCVLQRMVERGGWARPLVAETMRSDALQQRYYQKGRTLPGPRVTNAQNVVATVHGYGLAVDIVHAKLQWGAPEKFWRSLALHAEACGLVAGAYWKRFPDRPHLQTGLWDGAPPIWAQILLPRGGPAAVWAALPSIDTLQGR